MPHFYRYRIEENYEPRSQSVAPAAQATPMVTRRSEAPAPAIARVKLLGAEVEINVPTLEDSRKLTQMFSGLESIIQTLKDENTLLRTEMAKIQDKMSQSPQAQNIANVSPQGLCDSDIRKIETDLTVKISGIEERINETDSKTQAKISELCDGIQDIRKAQEINESSTRDKITHLEQLISAHPSNEATEVSLPSAPITKQPPAQEDDSDLKLFVLQTVEATKDLVRSPLSVIFDAVRSEDFVGEDNFLTFSKTNVNLGEGLNVDTGRFTVPTSGVYMFLLNVYGAPRDPVGLSIKLNDMKVLAGCSGVGKASQTCLADLNQGDTVAVFVNDKTKLTDSDAHRYTHFVGVLLRPDNIRF